MELFRTTSLFDWNYGEWKGGGHKVIINSGGTYSSKTYSLLQLLFVIGISESGSTLTVVADTVPNLKKGAFRDFLGIISSRMCKNFVKSINMSDRVVYLVNGSLIEFCSYVDTMDARSGKRDYLFINECNAIDFDVYQELATRTKKNIFLDFNPTSRFWVHDHLLGMSSSIMFRSWYIHNQELGLDKIAEIEAWKDSPIKYYQNRWRVMGLGMLGIPEGSVFSDWQPIDVMPDIPYIYVIDFGYNVDPTCVTKVGFDGMKMYCDVLVYETGLTTLDLAKRMFTLGIGYESLIIADWGGGGNMNISQLRNVDGSMDNIEGYGELRNGFNIVAAIKGAGSINIGINKILQHEVFVKSNCKPAWDEFVNYVRKKNPNGGYGDPVDAHNHFCDTIRYAALARGRLF